MSILVLALEIRPAVMTHMFDEALTHVDLRLIADPGCRIGVLDTDEAQERFIGKEQDGAAKIGTRAVLFSSEGVAEHLMVFPVSLLADGGVVAGSRSQSTGYSLTGYMQSMEVSDISQAQLEHRLSGNSTAWNGSCSWSYKKRGIKPPVHRSDEETSNTSISDQHHQEPFKSNRRSGCHGARRGIGGCFGHLLVSLTEHVDGMAGSLR
jgi:hypothetical protein